MHKNSCLIMSLIFLLVFLSAPSFSSEENNSKIIDLRYRAVRAMGMGDAFGALADDGDAFFYNPSGIIKSKKVRIDIQPVRFIPTKDFYNEIKTLDELIDDIDKIKESQEPLTDPNLKAERTRIINRIEQLTQENLGLDVGVPIRFIIPLRVGSYGVAIGGVSNTWSSSQIKTQKLGLKWKDPIISLLDDEILYKIMAETSYGLASAITFPLFFDLSCGLYARRIHRAILTNEDDPLQIKYLLDPYGPDGIKGTDDDFENRYFDPNDPLSSVAKGKGYSIDASAITSIGDILSLSLVLQNMAGKINYDKIKDEKLQRHVNLAGAIKFSNLLGISPIAEINACAGLNNINNKAKVQAGLEAILKVAGMLSVSGRIGSNQGFLTIGAGIKLLFINLDYAFFGDEITDWHAFSLNFAF